MVCPECGKAVESDQRFCNGCGAPLAGVTDATQPVDEVAGSDDPADSWVDHDPVWAPTAPAVPSGTATSELPSTEPVTAVEMEAVEADAGPAQLPATPYDFTDDEPTTTAMPQTRTATAEMPVVTAPARPDHHFRFSVVVFVAIVTAVVTLVAVFANIVTIESSTRLQPVDDTPAWFGTGHWMLDDLADNLSITGLIAAISMVTGGIAAGFRWRWGSGLAAGAGLAFAGVAAIGLGLAQFPIDAAHEFAAIPNEQEFTLTVTRDLGYWLLVAAGVLGVVVFFASIGDAIDDHRSGLNPWIAALGALAGVVAASGPLIPENLAAFSDNWYLSDAPGSPSALLLIARLVQLGLLVVTSVVGFLMVRRYGIGLAVGGLLPVVWLVVSVLFDLTDRPVGPAYRNPGATDIDVHGVTIIGVSALTGMAVLAAVAAYDLSVRERH